MTRERREQIAAAVRAKFGAGAFVMATADVGSWRADVFSARGHTLLWATATTRDGAYEALFFRVRRPDLHDRRSSGGGAS